MGKYIWNFSGRTFRIAIGEMKNKKMKDGLNLSCLASMADSLLFSQLCRLINSGEKTLGHAFYWLGDILENLAPGIDSAPETPEYFAHVADVVAKMMISDMVNEGSMKNIKNKTDDHLLSPS